MNNPVNSIYTKCRSFLANHKGFAFFLSHGGLHLSVLVLLLVTLIIMLNQLNKIDQPDTEIFKFEFSVNNGSFDSNSPYRFVLQNFDAQFEFRQLDSHSQVDIDILTAYRPYISRDSLSDKMFNSYTDIFYPQISIQTRPKLQLSETLFCDSMVYFPTHTNSPKIGNPYKEWRDSTKYELSGRIDSIQIHSIQIHSSYDETTWIRYFGCRKRIPDTDYIRLKRSFYTHKYKDSPYYNIYLRFRSRGLCRLEPDTTYTAYGINRIIIRFPDRLDGIHLSSTLLHPISFKTIQPTPSKIGLNYIEYDDLATINEILNSGIYIAAEDVEGARHATKLSFIYSVLLGTIIAFMLDILIQLILKWRKLSASSTNKNAH